MAVRPGTVLTILLLSISPVPAADLEVRLRERPATADEKGLDKLMPPRDTKSSIGESWWQQVVRKAPGCLAFSDGCRTCTKGDAGFACSNIPIACQPKEWACSKP